MPSSANTIIRLWSRMREVIDRAIEARLSELPEALIIDAARYIAMGGKRLRGFLLISIATTLGANVEDALDAAVAVELVHASSLALDDIIDEDLVRRGSEAAWVKLGLKKTVMVSNLLIPYAQRIVYKRYGELALERTVQAWLDISRGEVIDAFTEPEGNPADNYLKMVRYKTGALFRLSAELGVIAAGRRDLVEPAGKLGEIIGVTYQIADDIRDSRDPVKVEKEPSLRMFLKWAGNPEHALHVIDELIDKAAALLRQITPAPPVHLRELPRFIVEAMLGPRH